MKKQITILMLTLLGVGALGAGFGVTAGNAQPAEPAAAEGHTHDYFNGNKCSCGAVRIEAEYAIKYGALGMNVRSANTDVTSHKTSGGAFVGDFDKSKVSNPSLTWAVFSTTAQSVSVDAWVANCEYLNSGSNAYRLEVNGTTYTTLSSLTPNDGKHWYRWENLTYDNVAFVKGANSVKLVSVNGYAVNVDCIDVYSAPNTLSTRNTIRMEAENGYIKGTPRGKDPVTSYTPVKQTAFYNNGEYAQSHDSGGGSVGDWYKGDTGLNAYFYVTKATTLKLSVGISWVSECFQNTAKRIWGVGVDGCEAHSTSDWACDESSTTSDSTYHDWMYAISNKSFEVAAGQHWVHVEANDNKNVNIDAIQVTALDADAVIFEGESANELVGFVNDNMHMTDYTENKGWCKDAEHHYYATAKTAFNALSSGARALITDEVFAAPYARLQAWARANNDVFNTANALVSNDTVATGVDTTTIIVLSMICILSTAAITLIVVKKKKRSVK